MSNDSKIDDDQSEEEKSGKPACECEECKDDLKYIPTEDDIRRIRSEFSQPRGLQKVFNLYTGSGGSGLSKENLKKWMKAAGLLDEKTGSNEQDFQEAFDKACKGERRVDFSEFKELIGSIAKDKKKETLEFFDLLMAAGPPKYAKYTA